MELPFEVFYNVRRQKRALWKKGANGQQGLFTRDQAGNYHEDDVNGSPVQEGWREDETKEPWIRRKADGSQFPAEPVFIALWDAYVALAAEVAALKTDRDGLAAQLAEAKQHAEKRRQESSNKAKQ